MTRDGRLHDVAWRDLVELTRVECFVELTLPVPWPLLGGVLFHAGWLAAGAVAEFFFFLTGLRLSHNAQHAALGISRRAHDLILGALSVLMLCSMHAVRVTHLHHHRHCLNEHDVEAAHVRRPWWHVVLTGAAFPIRLHRAAWRLGRSRDRRWIVAELSITAFVVAAATVLGPNWLRLHFGAMAIGQCLTAFFAVWTVHHGCSPDGQIARTQRGRLKNFVTYSMFYHLEHHLFPAVPTCHLPRLAERIDLAAPELRDMQVY